MNLEPLQLVVFDLDNTMVDETEWLYAAYRAIALSIETQTGNSASSVSEYIIDRFVNQGRENLFQDVCERFDLPLKEIGEWLGIMRSVRLDKGYRVFDWVVEFCHSIPALPKAVLTNGNPRQQKTKFLQLAPEHLQREFKLYCAADFVSKPSPQGLLHIMEEFQVPCSSVLFIGDSEEDKACALGAKTEFLNAARFRYQTVSSTMSHLSEFISLRFGSPRNGQGL